MITNKEVIEQGKIVQHYSIDHNPFTGKVEQDAGFENLVMYDNAIYSVLTDFTGSVADPTGTPDVVTDDAQTFMEQMFIFDDPEEVMKAEADEQEEYDAEQWELWDDWMRDDDW